jgi:hypothetical protein
VLLTEGYNTETDEIMSLYELTITRGMSTTALVLIISVSYVTVAVLLIFSVFLIKKHLAGKQKPKDKVEQDENKKLINQTEAQAQASEISMEEH